MRFNSYCIYTPPYTAAVCIIIVSMWTRFAERGLHAASSTEKDLRKSEDD